MRVSSAESDQVPSNSLFLSSHPRLSLTMFSFRPTRILSPGEYPGGTSFGEVVRYAFLTGAKLISDSFLYRTPSSFFLPFERASTALTYQQHPTFY